MLDGEEAGTPTKKQNMNTSACEGGGVVQTNYTLINIISSADVSIRNALLESGVVEEERKCLKEEEE